MINSKITIEPRVIQHLGQDLITSPEVAVTELLKNSIDARVNGRACEINIHLFNSAGSALNSTQFNSMLASRLFDGVDDTLKNAPLCVIEDNGVGMTPDILKRGYLSVGTDRKKEQVNTLGEKGIGRLSTQRLGRAVVVETVSDHILSVMRLDWNRIISGQYDVQIHDSYTNSDSYTRIWILGVHLNDFLDIDDQLSIIRGTTIDANSELKTAITFLISPFNHTYSSVKDQYKISMFYENEPIVAHYDMDILSCSESIHYFRINVDKDSKELKVEYGLDLKPWFVERTHKVLTSSPQVFKQLRQKHSYYADFVKKYKDRIDAALHHSLNETELVKAIVYVLERQYKKKELTEELRATIYYKAEQYVQSIRDILPAESQIYTFKQNVEVGEKIILESLREQEGKNFDIAQLKKFLSDTNGVKLYRDVFRIGFLGNKENDWIKLQQYRTKGQQFYRFDLGNTLGYVSINDPGQKIVREISSRLDLIETKETSAFKLIINIMFNQVFYDLNRTANLLIKALLQEDGLLQGDIAKQIKKNSDELRKMQQKTEEIKKVVASVEQLLQDHTPTPDGKQIIIPSKTFKSTMSAMSKVSSYFAQSVSVQSEAIQAIEDAQQHLIQINADVYNNYKLMANGIITEAITHELDSVSRTSILPDADERLSSIKSFLLNNNGIDIYNDDYVPIRDSYSLISRKLSQVADLYNFLEATFIHKGSYDVFEDECISDVVMQVEENLAKKLKPSKIHVVCNTKNMTWYVPRGVLLHVFYNLFSNSAYWIDQRKRWAVSDTHFTSSEKVDYISVEAAGKNAVIVSDSGTGIISSMEDVLFEALQSGKSYSERRGMGLYIVKMLLSSFGANIELLPDRNAYGNRYRFLITYK